MSIKNMNQSASRKRGRFSFFMTRKRGRFSFLWEKGRVESWRSSLGSAYLFLPLSSGSASIA